jgi:hypothetical protein
MALTKDTSIAKLIAVPLAFAASGYGLCASHNTMSGIYSLPASISIPLFSHVFYTGAQIIVPFGLLSATASAYLAWKVPRQRTLWIAAAVSVLSTQAWTRLAMFSGIRTLLAIAESTAEQARVQVTGEHIGLLKTWDWQNYVRAGMFFVGGVNGFIAALEF